MSTEWIIGGAALILAAFGLMTVAMARTVGWAITAGIWAVALLGTAILTAGAFAIAYGIAGSFGP